MISVNVISQRKFSAPAVTEQIISSVAGLIALRNIQEVYLKCKFQTNCKSSEESIEATNSLFINNPVGIAIVF